MKQPLAAWLQPVRLARLGGENSRERPALFKRQQFVKRKCFRTPGEAADDHRNLPAFHAPSSSSSARTRSRILGKPSRSHGGTATGAGLSAASTFLIKTAGLSS